jgi:hypothetical protein
LKSLLFNYMDEFLFRFSTEGICCKRAEIERLMLNPPSIVVKR